MTYRPIKLMRKSTMSSIVAMAGAISISRQSFASGHCDMMWISSETFFPSARFSAWEEIADGRPGDGWRSHLRRVERVRVVARRVRRRRNAVRRVERVDIVVIVAWSIDGHVYLSELRFVEMR